MVRDKDLPKVGNAEATLTVGTGGGGGGIEVRKMLCTSLCLSL